MAIAILGISIKCPPVQMYLSRTQYKYSDSFSFQNAASAGYSYPTSPVGKSVSFLYIIHSVFHIKNAVCPCQTVTQLNQAVVFIVYRLVQLGLYEP